ncbi:MAG: class I SAM-dependent methyltransferase [Planctomycetaceae bacterium]|nr:class I SAM-dependent methyltransferase [Planctomycetaceae bacterium]
MSAVARTTLTNAANETNAKPQIVHCPACGFHPQDIRPSWKFVNSRGETEWLKCPDCHSYYMNKPYDLDVEVAHTQTMAWGDTTNGEQLNDIKQRMYRSIVHQLSKYISPEGKSLLDVGCSYGGFMLAAKEAGFDVCGFDIVPAAIASVHKQGLSAQCCSKVREFDLRTDPFDVISVLDANMYWPSQPEELSEIYNRLKPGGLMIMRIVDKSWMARIGSMLQHVSPAQGQKLLRRAVNDHRFSMPAASFVRVLEKSGFHVISASPKGAVHSDDTSLSVKASFAIGTALWQTLGIFVAPGAVILAERPA